MFKHASHSRKKMMEKNADSFDRFDAANIALVITTYPVEGLNLKRFARTKSKLSPGGSGLMLAFNSQGGLQVKQKY